MTITLNEVKSAIAFYHPKLQARQDGQKIFVEGRYCLYSSSGPIDEFDIKIILDIQYPNIEPKIFEIGERIKRVCERHINNDGSCCITIWDAWLIKSGDCSFKLFLDVPVHNFFLSQYCYERKKVWPFGCLPHGLKGIKEAFAEKLNISKNCEVISNYLEVLSRSQVTVTKPCPCGSGKTIFNCHIDKIRDLREKISSYRAKSMLRKLKENR